MNKYLFGFSVILLFLVILLSNVALTQYKDKKKAQQQIKVEQEAVYKMEQINHLYELEKKKLTDGLDKEGLCGVRLKTNL